MAGLIILKTKKASFVFLSSWQNNTPFAVYTIMEYNAADKINDIYPFQVPWVQRTGPRFLKADIKANLELNFDPSFFFFCSKAFSWIIVSNLFRACNRQIVEKKN